MSAPEEDRDFEVELHIAGGAIVKWTISAEWLRNRLHPAVAAAARDGTREGLRSAAVTTLEWIMDPKRLDEPVSVIDGDDALWMIDGRAVVAIRFFDPVLGGGGAKREVGFVDRGDQK